MASKGVNKVIIVGNLGNDPEVNNLPSGGMAANISVATSEQWKDKQTGKQQEKTEWHRIVFFNRLAEIVSQYLKKGAKVYIEGSIRTRKWQNKEGHDMYTTEIVAREMQMLDSRESSSNESIAYSTQRNENSSPQQTGKYNAPFAETSQQNNFDDDIPF